MSEGLRSLLWLLGLFAVCYGLLRAREYDVSRRGLVRREPPTQHPQLYCKVPNLIDNDVLPRKVSWLNMTSSLKEAESTADWFMALHQAAVQEQAQIDLEVEVEDPAFTDLWLEMKRVLLEAESIGYTLSYVERPNWTVVLFDRYNRAAGYTDRLALTRLSYVRSICAEFAYRQLYFAIVSGSRPVTFTFENEQVTCARAARLILEPFLLGGRVPQPPRISKSRGALP